VSYTPGTFSVPTMKVPAQVRTTVRQRAALMAAVIGLGRAVSETARTPEEPNYKARILLCNATERA
jgi:hypothetical protein